MLGWITTTDHKRIGLLYLFASLLFFAAGGFEALLIRTQLIKPDNGLVGPAAYDELFTMHGVTMIFLFVIPILHRAFGNYLLPLMIGARDMAFPRLNALSFWMFPALGHLPLLQLGDRQTRPTRAGSTTCRCHRAVQPRHGIDFYCARADPSTASRRRSASINFIVTIFKLRAPGMSINRMPLFCFAFLAVSFALIFALPPLPSRFVLLELDRRFGIALLRLRGAAVTRCCGSTCSGSSATPRSTSSSCRRSGIATSIIPTFCRRPMVAFPLVAVAELLSRSSASASGRTTCSRSACRR